MTAHRRTLRALERIVVGLEELDASFGSLPQEAKELIDTSALQALDAAGVRKLALAVEDIVGGIQPGNVTVTQTIHTGGVIHGGGDTFVSLGTVTDRVLDDVRRHMAAKRQAAE